MTLPGHEGQHHRVNTSPHFRDITPVKTPPTPDPFTSMTPSRRHVFLGQAFFCLLAAAASPPTVTDTKQNVTYHGLAVNAVEKFLNIPYGQDTSGQNRFANPEPYVFSRNISAYDASKNGPVCPQDTGAGLPYESPVPLSTQSEDCLKLKVARPRGVKKGDGLPVMVWIYGGKLRFFSSTFKPSIIT